MTINIEPVGYIHSPFKEKFGIPRQPSLVPSATSTLTLCGDYNAPETVRDIEQFSHLWLLFVFDQNLDKGWTPTVRPPRLGGNKRVGVFASRSTFRPNPIGMSAVELKSVSIKEGQVVLNLGGVDLVDGTPIIDVKPYIPYSDAVSSANGGYAPTPPEALSVVFSYQAKLLLEQSPQSEHTLAVISEVLAQDPRPAYKKNKADDKEYGVKLFNFNVKFVISNKTVHVTQIDALA